MTTTARPELGKLEPGQPVMVRRSHNDRRYRDHGDEYIPAKVVKVGRVWVDLERSDLGDLPRWSINTWRMRMDRQSEATNYSGSDASFATLDQHEWDKAQTWALAVLRDNGIRLDRESPWAGREVELANMISRGENV